MEENYAAPIRHSGLSAAGSTAAGAVGGGLKTGLKTYGTTVIATAVIGAVLGVLIATGGFGLFAVGTGMLGTAFWGGIGGGLLGGLGGALVIGPFAGMFGGLFGAAKGGSHAAHRVREETGAAQVLDAQVQAYQAQALAGQSAPMNIYAPSNDNKYNFPAPGTPMNPALASIQADSVQNQGRLGAQQLQIA